MWKKIWNDPVWSKVISAAIIAIVGLVGTYLLNWWPAFGRWAGLARDFATSATSLPNWAIGLLVMLAVPTLLLAFFALWIKIFPGNDPGPDFRTYTSDLFFGLRWQWRYAGEHIVGMHTLCPNCHFQVYPEHASAFSAVDRITYSCESCGSRLGTFDESFESLENKATRFAQQKLRTGAWIQSDSSVGSPVRS